MHHSYRKLLNKWKRLPKRRRKSTPPPSVEDNMVVELHIDTYRLEKKHGFIV